MLLGLILEVVDQFWFHVIDNDINLLMLKRMMYLFEYVPSFYKELFQEIQVRKRLLLLEETAYKKFWWFLPILFSKQTNGCCGVDQWRDYGPLPRRVPDSCCGRCLKCFLFRKWWTAAYLLILNINCFQFNSNSGKYFGRNFQNVGSCAFEDLEKTSGCGGGVFLSVLQGSASTWVLIAYNLSLMLFYGFQALTAVTAWMFGFDLSNLAKN